MSISDKFSTFCANIRIDDDDVVKISNRYKQITKRINLDYYNSSSETLHSLYVGSYGRGTDIHFSDIDMIVQLPYSNYERFNKYTSGGQSALERRTKSTVYI